MFKNVANISHIDVVLWQTNVAKLRLGTTFSLRFLVCNLPGARLLFRR